MCIVSWVANSMSCN